ncbi:MAG: calcium/sodium antiporter [Chlamydiia bacterium]|nr:calcium/sodium antiporter [Chlamydiia bacterium]
MISVALWFLFGLALLVLGAEILVRGAVKIAALLGISPLIIGLTIVAFGTGAPELVVSIFAARSGETAIALGNVVGSNIINILLILGLTSVIAPTAVHHQLVKIDVPIMIFASVFVYGAALYGAVTPAMGAALAFLILAYTLFSILNARAENGVLKEFESEFSTQDPFSWGEAVRCTVMILLGIFLLGKGSEHVVGSATEIAVYFGLSQLLIGLTIVALGTSLPELATSLVAALRGKRDIAVGNIIGSNIFNIFAVLGIAALVAPGGIPIPKQALNLDIPVMLACSIACLPIFFTKNIISRWEGALFLIYYGVYNAYLITDALGHPWIAPYNMAFYGFLVPLTLLTIGINLFHHAKA